MQKPIDICRHFVYTCRQNVKSNVRIVIHDTRGGTALYLYSYTDSHLPTDTFNVWIINTALWIWIDPAHTPSIIEISCCNKVDSCQPNQ